MDRNKLALLTNELGSYDEVENVIGVDARLIQRAVEGERLNSLEQAEVETGFNKLYLYPEIAEDAGIDVHSLFDDGITAMVYDVDKAFYDVHRSSQFRKALAEGRITTDDLETAELLFKDGYATAHIQEKLLDWLNEDRTDEKIITEWINDNPTRKAKYQDWINDNVYAGTPIKKITPEAFLKHNKRANSNYNKWFGNDRTAKEFLEPFAAGGYRLDDIEDSEFWEWYRNTFY